jgi:UDP-GlcNAc:undecaprenyl-phosphate/decaprenyl-phosphate GlcNAc-1-phosphate transferase
MNGESFAKYPIVFLVALFATYLLTPIVIRLSTYLGIVDSPAARRIHQGIIPRAGGVSLFIGFHLGCSAIFLLPWPHLNGYLDRMWWQTFLLISGGMFLIGLIDDVRGLSPKVKLAAQCLAASWLYYLDPNLEKIFNLELPMYLSFFFSVCWIVAITNAFNLIDGLDGLAAGLAFIACIGLSGALIFRHLPGDGLVFLALAGACLAFLQFNSHPAKIFMGDSGSLFLGFTVASLTLETSSKGTAIATFGVPLLAVGIPLFDTMLAIWRRAIRRILALERNQSSILQNVKIMGADLEHVHHRLLSKGYSQRTVTHMLYASALLLVTVSLSSLFYHSYASGIFILAFICAAYVIVRHIANVELWDSSAALLLGLQHLRHPILPALLYPIFDALLLSISLAVSLILSSPVSFSSEFRQIWFESLPHWCAVPCIVMIFSRTYQRVWSRARITEYALLAGSIAVGILMSVAISLIHPVNIYNAASSRVLVAQAIIHFSLSVLLTVGLRIVPRIIQDLRSYFGERSGISHRNILVCGADTPGLLYLRQRALRENGKEVENQSRIVGIIDDDRYLRNRLVHGYRVLGTTNEIPLLIKKHAISEVVITTKLTPIILSMLSEIALQENVRITEWKTVEWDLPKIQPLYATSGVEVLLLQHQAGNK